MEVVMIRTPSGALVPMDDAEQDKTKRWKSGAVIRGDFTEMRNGQFFRKWWSLVKLAYEMWEDTLPEVEYKGMKVRPEFERFRKDVTILAGYCRPVFNTKGDMRLEADSLQWSKMDEERFTKLYEATLTVILEKVLSGHKLSREKLDDAVERVLRFA